MPRISTFGIACFVAIGLGPPSPAQRVAAPAPAPTGPDRPAPEGFLVRDGGCALLGPDGRETERLESITNGAGAISPDGLWAAFSQSEPNPPPGQRRGRLVIRSRVRRGEHATVPLVWGTTGSSFLPLWSGDSKRILICEQGSREDGSRGSAYRIYDLGSKSLTKLKLPAEWWPSDWSADGRRLLTSLPAGNGSVRVAWVRIDGVGDPEFLTSDREVAYGAKLSPDNQRILCMVGPLPSGGGAGRPRLCVFDLATKNRTAIDKPGHTHGHCWSSDGSKVAYTWQLPPRPRDETAERKTYLITCDPDGGHRKTIAMRKYEVPPNSSARDGVVIFFEVLAWWR